MFSKKPLLVLCCVLLGFGFYLLDRTSYTLERQIHPLGIVVRPGFFSQFIDRLNQLNTDTVGLSIQLCEPGYALEGNLWFQLNLKNVFRETPNHLNLVLELNENTKFEGKMWDSCERNRHLIADLIRTEIISTGDQKEENLTFEMQIDAQKLMETRSDPFISLVTPVKGLASRIQFDVPDYENVNKDLNSQPIKEFLLKILADQLARRFSNEARAQVRNLFYLESISGVVPYDRYEQEGTLFTQGPLRVDLDAPQIDLREIAFSFIPNLKNATFIGHDDLEIYVNASFLNQEDLKSLWDVNPPKTRDALIQESRRLLENTPIERRLEFKRPNLPPSNADLSLVIPTSLIQEALRVIYKEGLLRFKTILNLGERGREYLISEAPDILQIVQISPRTEPRIHFEANRLQLAIENYSLDVGTYLEDRMIPSSRVLTKASITASLVLDRSPRDASEQTINLRLDPSTFQVELEELKGQMGSKNLEVLRLLADGLWKDFFNRYPTLGLFQSVIEFQETAVEIVDIHVSPNHIILDLHLQPGEIK